MQRSRRLFDSIQLTNGALTYYTAANVRAKNLWLTITNPNASSYLATVYFIKSGGTADDTVNVLVYKRTVLPGQTVVLYEACGNVMEDGDFIQAKADTSSKLIFAGSGDEVSI